MRERANHRENAREVRQTGRLKCYIGLQKPASLACLEWNTWKEATHRMCGWNSPDANSGGKSAFHALHITYTVQNHNSASHNRYPRRNERLPPPNSNSICESLYAHRRDDRAVHTWYLHYTPCTVHHHTILQLDMTADNKKEQITINGCVSRTAYKSMRFSHFNCCRIVHLVQQPFNSILGVTRTRARYAMYLLLSSCFVYNTH